jgi:hypothetical protein
MSKEDVTNPHEEPCLGCGEETAIGSVFFSDRHVVDGADGTRAYLCSACVARVRAAGHDDKLAGVRTVGDLAMIGLNIGLPS